MLIEKILKIYNNFQGSTECELLRVNLEDLLIFVILSDELATGYTGLLTLSTLLLLEQ